MNSINIPLVFWFNRDPSLAFPMMKLSYGKHIDENGETYEHIMTLIGNESTHYRVYHNGATIIPKAKL